MLQSWFLLFIFICFNISFVWVGLAMPFLLAAGGREIGSGRGMHIV